MKIEVISASILLVLSSTIVSTIAESDDYDTDESYDYVIFTNNYLKKSIEKLIEWRENQGFKIKVITDLKEPEEIRNFLKSNYLDWGIEYILIVGSYKTIPMKYCWPYNDYHKPQLLENRYGLPTDHYYAELTYDWDLDKDGYFGEFEDDIKNNTDLLPEISVGRIPFDNPLKVKDFCKKIIRYEQDNDDWKKKTLFLAGVQEYKEQYIDLAFFAEKLQNEIFLINGFNCTKLYETEGLKPSNYTYDLPLNRINSIKTLREGYGFISIMGRGTSRSARRYVWTIDNDDGIADENDTFEVSNRYIFISSFDKFFLKNDKPSVIYSFTCYTAQTKTMNLCSSLLDSTGVVFIGPTVGNQGGWQLKYNFTEYFASTNMRLGDAFFTAKQDYIKCYGGIDSYLSYFNDISVMWTILNTGFYGDPATIKFLPPIT